jgi:hypothetical protein
MSAAMSNIEDSQADADTNPHAWTDNTRLVNESAIKEYALKCSAKFRAGKFKRVGSEFMDEVKADVEAAVRHLRGKYTTPVHEPLYTQDGHECPKFATGNLLDKFEREVNEAIARIVQAKVQAQPSCGQTLSRTR